MKRLFLFVLLASSLVAQVQVAKSQTTVTGTTGTMVCNATSVAIPTVSLKCVNGSDTFQSSGPISVGTVAQTITINSTGGAQTWQFTLPSAAGPYRVSGDRNANDGVPCGIDVHGKWNILKKRMSECKKNEAQGDNAPCHSDPVC